MKVYYSNLLTNLTGIVGVTGISLLIGLPVKANNAFSPRPSVFKDTPYNPSLAVRVNVDNSSEAVIRTFKSNKSNKTLFAQSSGALNPRPSILDECPYNRAACGNRGPAAAPAPLPSEPQTVPTAPLPEEIPTAPPMTPPGAETEPTQPTSETENQNIIDIASSNPSFTVLTQALQAAGLVDTLKGNGPFTVFAPSDAAFAKLPQDAVQDLLKPENKEVLVKILTYHVVQGQVLSTDLQSGEVTSIEGGPISVKVDPATGVQVNDATVVQPDIKASNGVIHVIDNVILPPDL
ncbi:MAG: fasciclin domain-containing protein [Cyanobacteria bacterium P01_D01_bin.50]